MGSSHEFRSWIQEARCEQRTLRDHGCHKAARDMQSGIDADFASLSDSMQREEREESPYLDDYDPDNDH